MSVEHSINHHPSFHQPSPISYQSDSIRRGKRNTVVKKYIAMDPTQKLAGQPRSLKKLAGQPRSLNLLDMDQVLTIPNRSLRSRA